ncbi:MAG TPA: hypothetical protein VKJ65_00315, partial [Phycisphaerae bacterium]|nr:hypothetical protein [Phycisphaerae bacterium]
MKHIDRTLIALSAGVAATLLLPRMADAVGPRNQYVSNASNAAATASSPIGDTVWVSTVGGTGGYGSGTVIGAQSIGGTDIIDILTADHVVTGESWGRIKFGTNPNLNAGDPGGP